MNLTQGRIGKVPGEIASLVVTWQERPRERVAPLVSRHQAALIRRHLRRKEVRTILDAGGGKGILMRAINRDERYFTVNLEISPPNLETSKKARSHDAYILGGASKVPFRRRTFDAVLCLDVIEHLSKADGWKMIEELEQTATKVVIIGSPVHPRQEHATIPNPFQDHVSSWGPSEFIGLGYDIIDRFSAPLIRGRSLHSYLPRILKPIGSIYWLLGSLIAMLVPKLGGNFLALKVFEPISEPEHQEHDVGLQNTSLDNTTLD